MRKFGYLIVLCCGVLFASGCATEAVKPAEPVAASQTGSADKAAVVDDAAKEAAARAAREARDAAERDAAAKARAAAAKEAPVTTTEPASSSVIKESAPQAAVAKATAKEAAIQKELTTIYFAFDSQELTPESREALSKNADFLGQKPELKIKIEGHCDERGSDEYNLALGERRAKSAMEYLLSLGVKGDRLSTISYGKEKPVDQGHDEASWAKNRRDDFVIVK